MTSQKQSLPDFENNLGYFYITSKNDVNLLRFCQFQHRAKTQRFIQTVSGCALGFRCRVSDRTDPITALETDDYSSGFQCV